MRDDELVFLLDERHQEPRDLGGVALVFLDRPLLPLLHESVAAHGDENDRLCGEFAHEFLPWGVFSPPGCNLTRWEPQTR